MKKRTLTCDEIAYTLDFMIRHSEPTMMSFVTKCKPIKPSLPCRDALASLVGFNDKMREQDAGGFGASLGRLLESLILTVLDASNSHTIEKPLLNGTDKIDFIYGDMAIDIKYSIGTRSQGFLLEMKSALDMITSAGLEPVFCVYSLDSNGPILDRLETMGWTIIKGDEVFSFIEQISGFDLKSYLASRKGCFIVKPTS